MAGLSLEMMGLYKTAAMTYKMALSVIKEDQVRGLYLALCSCMIGHIGVKIRGQEFGV